MHHCREAVEGFVKRLIAEGANADLWRELRDLEIMFGSTDDLDAAVYASLVHGIAKIDMRNTFGLRRRVSRGRWGAGVAGPGGKDVF